MAENWLKALGISVLGTGLVFAGAGLGGVFDKQDTSNLVSKADLTALKADLGALDQKVTATAQEVLREDIWEASAEVLVLEELEDKDYKELKQWILDEYSSDFLSSDDYKDFEDFKVVVKDKDVTSADSDDKDATVELELKVYYEDKDGDSVKRSVLASALIDDGEVEDLEFE